MPLVNKVVNLIKAAHKTLQAFVAEGSISKEFKVRNVVKQCCVLVPAFFHSVSQY